jgi:hypothetical protein
MPTEYELEQPTFFLFLGLLLRLLHLLVDNAGSANPFGGVCDLLLHRLHVLLKLLPHVGVPLLGFVKLELERLHHHLQAVQLKVILPVDLFEALLVLLEHDLSPGDVNDRGLVLLDEFVPLSQVLIHQDCHLLTHEVTWRLSYLENIIHQVRA